MDTGCVTEGPAGVLVQHAEEPEGAPCKRHARIRRRRRKLKTGFADVRIAFQEAAAKNLHKYGTRL
jgi:hypothetical protein